MVSVSPNSGNPSGECDEGPGRDRAMQVTVLPGEEELCSQSPQRAVRVPGKGSAERCLGSNPSYATKGFVSYSPRSASSFLISEMGI